MNQEIGGPKKWAEIINFTKEKLLQTDIKAAQLRALLKRFEAQKAAGEPTPLEVAQVNEKRVGF